MPAVQIECPNCARSYSVDSQFIGHKARCKHCGQLFALSSSVGPGGSSTIPSGPSTPPTSTSVPDRVGRFQIRERLGAGAFGTVYRAYDPVLNREVALKIPHPGTLLTIGVVDRFLRESKAAAQLRHPNIVPIYDAGVDGTQHYIASAYIEGPTLAEVIDFGRMESQRATRIVLDLAEALHYAHRLGIIHRDVKPANVMLDAAGVAQLMDFGLARFELSEEKLTLDEAILGTPAYMAPEQARDAGAACSASDQYSLGIVLYELLCGQTPFSGSAPILLFNAIHNAPPRLREREPAIPLDLETICLKALAKSPSDRYASCGDLADDIRHFLLDEPIRARPLNPFERLGRWRRRNPALASASGLAALSLVAFAVIAGAFAVTQSRSARREKSLLSAASKAYEQAKADRDKAQSLQSAALKAYEQAKADRDRAQSLVIRFGLERGRSLIELHFLGHC